MVSDLSYNSDAIYNEIKNQFKNDKKKNKVSISVYIVLFVILLIPLFVYLVRRKPYVFVSSFDNLPDPVQMPISWWTALSVLWKKFNVDFLASYDIDWKVILIKDFSSMSDFSDKISPKDFVLWWWFMWVQENIDKFIWNDGLDGALVFAYVKSENREWLDELWSRVKPQENYSNNRLIPGNKKVRLMLNKICEWDEVRIKWYLAYVYLEDKSWYWWPSSMSRDDKWYEIIFVTDVTWLREI